MACTAPYRPTALALSLLLLGAIAHLPAAAQGTSAASPAAARSWQLPAAPLGDTLARIAREAGRRISADPALLQGKQAAAIEGLLTTEQAAQRALAGSGLQLAVTPGGALTVVAGPAPAPTSSATEGTRLSEVTVKAAAERDGTTEGSGRYTAAGPSSTATGLGLTLRETPQSISVVTQQQMQDLNMQSLDDVAATATGITTSKVGTERSTYSARGFEVTDLQFDGMAVSVAENYSLDALSLNNLAIYDRVEIVRGANGLMQGTGNPSAAINLVRKRPTRAFQLKAELGAGSWADYRGQLDVSGPLNAEGTLRGRAVVYANNANSFKTGSGTDNKLLYGIVEADLTAATTLTLGATVQTDDHRGYEWGGLVTRADGSFYDLPRSTSLAGDWAHLDRTNTTAFGDLVHRFDSGWKLTAAFRAVQSRADYVASYPARVAGGSGNLYRLVAVDTDYKDRQLAVDLKASGPFTLLGRQHELMLGASHRRDDFRYQIYTASNTPTVDITNFDYSAIPEPAFNYAAPSNYHLEREETGLSAATRLRASDALSVIVGARLSRSEYKALSPYVDETYKPDQKLVPYAGLVYALNPQHTLYASYTDIYKIQSYYGPNGLLAPVQGRNYEAGVKSDFFEGRLHTALALFQVDQVNLPESLGGARTCGIAGSSTCYTEGGKVRNRGVEVELSGSPRPGWNLSTGFTYSDPEYIAGSDKGKDYNTGVPRRLFKLATDVRLGKGPWRVGGDLQVQSGAYTSASSYFIAQGGYTLLNLHANYQYDRHFSVQLNLRNALDKHYVVNVPGSNNFGYVYTGTPRNVAVTLRYQY